jgi:hypothetical protein
MIKTILVPVLLCLALCSCKDEYTICNESRYSIMNGQFLKRTSRGDSTLKAPSLTIINLGNSNTIYNQEMNIGYMNLALSPAADSARFSIKFSSTAQQDTLTVKYLTAQDYLSLECGSIEVFTITNIKYTRHRIDTIKVIDPAIRNRSDNNLAVYF